MAQRRIRELDDSIVFDDDPSLETKSWFQNSTLIIAALVLSPSVGFCWRLMLISFLVAYHYTLSVIRSCRRIPECSLLSVGMASFALKTIFKIAGLVAVAVWCLSLTPVHVFVPTVMDLWTTYTLHDPLRMTQTVYDPGKEATVDIFAIHGLGSRPDSAWTYKSNATHVHWLSDLLPRSEGLEDARVIMVNHQTRWDANSADMDLADHASELLSHIESHHKANPTRPVIFISHSFGGILLKKASALLLAKARSKDIAAMTRGIIFLGVPHRGTNAAYAASCLSCMAFFRGSSSHLLQLMVVDSPGLLDLESEFYDAYVIQDHAQRVQPYICDILETRPERMGKLALGSIVRPKHGLLRHGRIFTLDTDHRGLNKFSSQDDPNFEIFSRILSQTVTHALNTDIYDPYPYPPRPPPPEVSLAEEFHAPPAEESQLDVTTDRHDILEYATYKMRWASSSTLGAMLIGAVHEYLASVLASDRDKHGNHFTARAPKMAMYASLFELPICKAFYWVLFKIFEGRTSLGSRLLQLSISGLMIMPMQAAIYLCVSAIIAGARVVHQVRATVRVGYWSLVTKSWIVSVVCILVADRFLVPAAWPWFLNSGLLLVQIYINAHIKKVRLEALRKKYWMASSQGAQAASVSVSRRRYDDVKEETDEGEESDTENWKPPFYR